MSHQVGSLADALLLNVYEGHKTDKQLALELRPKNGSYYGCNGCASSDMFGAQRRTVLAAVNDIYASGECPNS
jgi:hypothetical protein